MNDTKNLIVKALGILSEAFVNAPPNVGEAMEHLGCALDELYKLEAAVTGSGITPDAAVQEKHTEQLYAVVLSISRGPIFGEYTIDNQKRPYLVVPGREKLARSILTEPGVKVVIADKATLIANSFDLCEEDFAEPLLIIGI